MVVDAQSTFSSTYTRTTLAAQFATDVFGDVAGRQSFYPFGEARASSGIFDTDHGFTGQIFDGGTGLGFYSARYYDTTLGRFISPDSIVQIARSAVSFNPSVT